MGDKKKIKGLLKKAVSKGKKALKKELTTKSLVKRAGGAVKDKVKDASKSRDSNTTQAQAKAIKRPEADISLSTSIELKGDRKKRRAKKKIAKWEKERKQRASVGSEQSKFLALDKTFKNKKKN